VGKRGRLRVSSLLPFRSETDLSRKRGEGREEKNEPPLVELVWLLCRPTTSPKVTPPAPSTLLSPGISYRDTRKYPKPDRSLTGKLALGGREEEEEEGGRRLKRDEVCIDF